MLEAFRSEWIKNRRRSMLIGAGLMPLLTIIFVPLGIRRALSGGGGGRFAGPGDLTKLVLEGDKGLTTLLSRGGTLSAVIALAIVASSMAVEYPHGTLRNLLVRQPRRIQLLSGKFLSLLTFVFIAGTLSLGLGVLTALLVAPGQGVDTAAWTSSTGVSNLVTLYWELLVTILGYSVLGYFSAVLFRSPAAAVAVPLVYIIILENLIGAVWTDAPNWLYGKLLGGVINGESVLRSDTAVAGLSRGLTLSIIYMAGMGMVSALIFRFRDVTS